MVAEWLYLPQLIEENSSCILPFLPFHIKTIPTCVSALQMISHIFSFTGVTGPFLPSKAWVEPRIRVPRIATPQGNFYLPWTGFQGQLSEITSVHRNLSCWDTFLLFLLMSPLFFPSIQCLYLMVGWFFKLSCRNREFIFSKHGDYQAFCKYKPQTSSKMGT